MAGAFQSNAFQNNAFQVDGAPPPPPIVLDDPSGVRGRKQTRIFLRDVERREDIADFLKRQLKARHPDLEPAKPDVPVSFVVKQKRKKKKHEQEAVPVEDDVALENARRLLLMAASL